MVAKATDPEGKAAGAHTCALTYICTCFVSHTACSCALARLRCAFFFWRRPAVLVVPFSFLRVPPLVRLFSPPHSGPAVSDAPVMVDIKARLKMPAAGEVPRFAVRLSEEINKTDSF